MADNKNKGPDPGKANEAADANERNAAATEAQVTQQKELNKAKERQLELDRESAKLAQDRATAAKLEKIETDGLATARKRASEAYQEFAKTEIESVARNAAMAADLITQQDIYENKVRLEKEALESIQQQISENKKLLDDGKITEDQYESRNELLGEDSDRLTEQLKLDKQRIKALAAQEKGLRKQSDATKKIADGTASIVTRLTGIEADSYQNSMMSAMSSVGGFTKTLNIMGQQLAKQMEPLNLLASLNSKIWESTQAMVVAFDNAQASFNRSSGAAGKYNDVIEDTRNETLMLGVDFESASEAIGALHDQMTDFTKMTKEAQVTLATTAATLNRVGVNAGDAAQLFDVMTRSLGFGAEETELLARESVGLAKALDVPVNKMTKDMKNSMKTLAAYGKQGVKVFKKLAAAAKATGLEMQALLGFASQFDTFEDAAESVGRLNGILGGNYLNSLEMVNMTEEERVRTIIASINASGKSWEAMDRFERKAIAASVGITDMNEANKLLGMNLDAYDDMRSKADANAASQEEMAEMAEAATSMMDKLKAMFQSLAVAVKPIVDAFHWVLNGLMAINEATGNFLIPTLVGLIAVYGLLRKVAFARRIFGMQEVATETTKAAAITANTAALTAQTAALQALVASQAAHVTAAPAVIGATVAEGAAAGAAAAPTAAFGLSLGMVAIAAVAIVGAIFGIIYALYKFLELMIENVDVLPELALGILLVGGAITALSLGFAAMIGVAPLAFISMALIGAGLVIIGTGLFLMGQGIQAMGGSGAIMNDVADHILLFSVTMLAAAPLLLAAGVIMFVGAGLMGVSLILLGAGLQMLGAGLDAADNAGERLLGLSLALLAAAPMLLLAGIFFLPGAVLVGTGAMILGLGLMALASGLSAYSPYIETFEDIIDSLMIFGFWSMFSAAFFLIGATMVGVGALLLGTGLFILGKGLDSMAGKAEVMAELSDVLGDFAWSLFWAGFLLLPAAFLIGPAALLLGLGFLALGEGLSSMAGMGNVMMGIGESIWGFSISLLKAAWPLFWASIFVGPSLLLLGAGLQEFGKGLSSMAGLGNVMIGFGEAIWGFAFMLWLAAPMINEAEDEIGDDLEDLGDGLFWFGDGLANMAGLGNTMVGFGEAIYDFALQLYRAAPMIDEAEDYIGDDLEDLGNGLILFAQGIGGMAGLGNVMVGFGGAIYDFAKQLEAAGPAIDEAEDEIGDDLEDLGEGLIAFAKGIAGLAGLGNIIVGFGGVIVDFATQLCAAGPAIDEAEDEIGDDLEDLGEGLERFAKGIAGLAGLGNVIVGFGQVIEAFAWSLCAAAPAIDEAEDEIGDDLEDIGKGLQKFGKGIANLAGLGNVMVGFGDSIFWFALEMMMAAPYLEEAIEGMWALEEMGDSLEEFSKGLSSLEGLGGIMKGFTNLIFPFALNIWSATFWLDLAAWPFYWASKLLNWGFEELAEAMEWVTAEALMTYSVALVIFSIGLSKVAEVGNEAADAIYNIGDAIRNMPRWGWWSISRTAGGVYEIAQALEYMKKKVGKQTIGDIGFMATGLVELASVEYGNAEQGAELIQKIALASDEVSVNKANAMAELIYATKDLAKQVARQTDKNTAGKDGEKGGKDIYLVLDKGGMQKIAKATGVHLDKMHNTLVKG